MAAVTPAIIIERCIAFLDDVISQTELRRRLLAAAQRCLESSDPICLQALPLVSQFLESSTSSSPASKPSASAIRTAEKLLLGLASKSVLASLLSALVHAVRCRNKEAALALLDIFAIDPFAARYEIAAPVFETLFIQHLLPVIQWFAEQRSRILASSAALIPDAENTRQMEMVTMSLLSRMSGSQTAALKVIEKGYEGVLDENTRAYADYLRDVIKTHGQGFHDLVPPHLVLTRMSVEEDEDEGEADDDEDMWQRRSNHTDQLNWRNGRYNPMWADADQSTDSTESRESDQRHKLTNNLSFHPRRVPACYLKKQSYTKSPENTDYKAFQLDPASSSDDSSEYSDSEIYHGVQEKQARSESYKHDEIESKEEDENTDSEIHCSSMEIVDSNTKLSFSKHAPPKDFVCPITSNLFNDPVTLETGQTYERKAIQEWLDRGNCTCPITRQKLQSTQLPKSNYVLKRLISGWIEQSSQSTQIKSDQPMQNGLLPKEPESIPDPPTKESPHSNAVKHMPSPTIISRQASMDTTSSELSLAVSRLCTSDVLNDSEMAVLRIEQLWKANSPELDIRLALSKPAILNGFIEILFNSVKPQVLRAAVFMLTEIASRDESVVPILTKVDSEVECIVSLFKNGLVEAAVLIHLLNLTKQNLIEMDILDALVSAIKRREEDLVEMCLKPRSAALLLLNQMLRGENGEIARNIVNTLISESVIEYAIHSLEADLLSERMAAVEILIKCMVEEGNCRSVVAEKTELSRVLESFAIANDVERFEIVRFLVELVKLNRTTSNEQILHIIKDEGAFSMLHSFLIYLQTARQDQRPVIASLLLQLDILVEPRKMSIYREEAVDTLISCLKNQDFPSSQLVAAKTILSLQGRYSSSGRSLARAYLLKRAGMNKSYRSIMRSEQMDYVISITVDNQEEESAAEDWERRIAFALVTHEFGLIFEALSEGLKSNHPEFFSTCLVSASWLTYMTTVLPDMGIRGAARVCLLKQFVAIFYSSRHADDKALALLGLRSFLHDPEGMHEISAHIKDIIKTLREFKKSSALAYEILKLFSSGQESSMEMWDHKELAQVDCSPAGEVLSIICFKNRIISGHLDGSIRVWGGSENLLQLIQETRDHSKAVTSLATSGEKMYSASLDKTVKVWDLRRGELYCTETHDVKDPVSNLSVSNTITCFTSQGAGVKILSWNGGSKLLNPNKYVKSLAIAQGKIYCGCHDSSIQEIDLATGTVGTVQAGNRKLLSKSNPIYVTRVHEGLLYTASNPLDGAAVKIWSTSNYTQVGSLPCTLEVRSMAISQDLIYLGCKQGTLEIWSREKHTKVATLQMGSGSAVGKINCLALNGDGHLVVSGSSDGKIQAWGLT